MVWIRVLVELLIGIVGAAYVCYWLAYKVPKRKAAKVFSLPRTEQYAPYREKIAQMIESARAIPYEEVWIEALDGVKLFGKYYKGAPDAPVQILFHGYRSAAERDFCGGLPFARSEGYNVLLVDQRAHGKSGGRCLTFGVKERFDCVSWIDYALARFGADTKIVLYGMSMGAATVLMAAGLSLPGNVQAIVADCGYTAPADILKKVMRDVRCPVWLFYPLLRLGGRLFGGFDVEAASAREAMSRCTIPVCLFHGEDDWFVPCEMSRENYSACIAENKRLLTFPGAGHGMSYLLDEERYLNELRAFLRLCL